MCRSDAAPESCQSNSPLGWLAETALPRRWPRNSKCERQICVFEEACRRLHLQFGFAVMPDPWLGAGRFAAIALSVDKWEKVFKTEFKGASYALGQLVFYRAKFQDKRKMSPNASPALMAGWKLECGVRYKGVLNVLDYAALEGKISLVHAPDREVYVRGEIVFPLSKVAEKFAKLF